jgi:hypothetical protein
MTKEQMRLISQLARCDIEPNQVVYANRWLRMAMISLICYIDITDDIDRIHDTAHQILEMTVKQFDKESESPCKPSK